MGLFDKILNIITSLDNNTAQSAEPVRPAESANTVQTSFDAPKQGISEDALLERLQSVIEKDFPDCSVQANVPASTFDPTIHPMAKPLSLLVTKEGKSVLAIAVVRANTYRSLPQVSTRKAVEALGIKYIRFFCEYDNLVEYISDRLAEYLR